MESFNTTKHGLENVITANSMILRRFAGESLTFDETKALHAARVDMNEALDMYPNGRLRPDISLELAHEISRTAGVLPVAPEVGYEGSMAA